MEWQPIETAPKNERVIIAEYSKPKWDEDGDHWSWTVEAAEWSEHAKAWMSDEGWSKSPTHWMPLPKPPNAS